MQRSFQLMLLFLSLIFLPFLPAQAQEQCTATSATPQARPAPPDEPKKPPELITSDTPSGLEGCRSLMQATGVTEKQDPALRAFLRSIAGRWNFAYVSNGNQNWWYNHSSSRPKSEIHYLFAPHALFFESRPEFALPSITGCFAYGSGHKVSTEVFDLEYANLSIQQPPRPADSSSHRTTRHWKWLGR